MENCLGALQISVNCWMLPIGKAFHIPPPSGCRGQQLVAAVRNHNHNVLGYLTTFDFVFRLEKRNAKSSRFFATHILSNSHIVFYYFSRFFFFFEQCSSRYRSFDLVAGVSRLYILFRWIITTTEKGSRYDHYLCLGGHQSCGHSSRPY